MKGFGVNLCVRRGKGIAGSTLKGQPARHRNSRVDAVRVAAAININGQRLFSTSSAGIAFRNIPLTITMKCRTGLASVTY